MSVKLFIGGVETPFISATWSGTENQAARKLDFTLP